MLTPAEFRELFLLDPAVVFLNHGSFGAVPRPVFEEQERLRRELEAEPVLFLARLLDDRLAAVRDEVGALVHADPDDLGLVPNTTTALNAVAFSLELGPGDEIVTTSHEYGAMAILWDEVSRVTGAKVRAASLPEPATGPTEIVDAVVAELTRANARPLLQPRHLARRDRPPGCPALRRGSATGDPLGRRRSPRAGTTRARPGCDRRRRLRRQPAQMGLQPARLGVRPRPARAAGADPRAGRLVELDVGRPGRLPRPLRLAGHRRPHLLPRRPGRALVPARARMAGRRRRAVASGSSTRSPRSSTSSTGCRPQRRSCARRSSRRSTSTSADASRPRCSGHSGTATGSKCPWSASAASRSSAPSVQAYTTDEDCRALVEALGEILAAS